MGGINMELIQEISEYLQKGRAKNVKALVQQAIDEGTMKFLFRKYWLQRVQ